MWEARQDAERSGRVKHSHARRLRHGCLASLQASVAGRSGQSPIRSEIASLPGPGQTTPHSGRGRTGNRENSRHYAPGIGTYVPFPEVGLAFQIGRWLDWPGRTPCRFLRQQWQRPSSLSSCAMESVQRGFHCEGGRVRWIRSSTLRLSPPTTKAAPSMSLRRKPRQNLSSPIDGGAPRAEGPPILRATLWTARAGIPPGSAALMVFLKKGLAGAALIKSLVHAGSGFDPAGSKRRAQAPALQGVCGGRHVG
jgi:hypothetical protein